jgi:uncharacterized protein
VLHHQLPWYVGGPVLGLCVVALRLLLNERLGITGAWSDVVERLSRRSLAFDARWLIAPILAGAGVLIGYGAKTAGGCTSGNGLSGNAQLSPASLVATATFFGTAIAVSFLIEALI